MDLIKLDEFKEGVNYFKTNSKKYQVILINTNKSIDIYNNSLKTRYRGKFDRIPAFSITRKGQVYQYYDPFNFYSNVMKNEGIDKIAILVALENYGMVEKSIDNDLIYDQYKNLIQENIKLYEKSWRNYNQWDKYSITQTYSLIDLLNYLLDNSDIEKNVITNNVYMDNAIKFRGVLTRSNYHKFYMDPNPSLDLELIRNEISGYG